MREVVKFYVYLLIDREGKIQYVVADDPSDTIQIGQFESNAYHLQGWAMERGMKSVCIQKEVTVARNPEGGWS